MARFKTGLVGFVCVAAIPLYFITRRVLSDGGYTEWSDWGKCSKECGEGVKTRRRDCTNPPSGWFGKTCLELNLGPPTEEKKCKIKECPVDGGFSDWSAFGECSKPCGDDGAMKRTRTCSNPPPQFGGEICAGSYDETVACNVKPCAIDGGFTEWTDFSDCDKTCGPGTKKRTRTCTNPPPNGGKNCEGPIDEVHECNITPCAVDGGFTEWGEFEACDKKCGGGVQTRKRTCTNPAPANGGKDCEGDLQETKACNEQACS